MEAIAELIWTGSYGTTTIDQLVCGAGANDQFFKDATDTQTGCEVELN